MLPFAKLLWTLVFASVMSAGQAADVSVQSASDETAKHVTGNSHDDVTVVDDDGDDDDEVVASRDHRVSMATADASSASSSASFPLLAATVELPSPPAPRARSDVVVTSPTLA